MLKSSLKNEFKSYILINFAHTSKEIIDLYEEDFVKIDGTGLAGDIYDAILANLSGNASRYVLSTAREGIRANRVRELIPDMLSSFTINIAYHANNPNVGMAVEKDISRYKLFFSDVGLFITLAFKDKDFTDNMIYSKSTHNRRERPIHGHRGGSRGRFYYRITTFEERPWDARDPHKTTFMALSYAIGLSI